MSWKNWPYWLRGGVIGLILPFIYVIIKGLILILIKGKCSVGCVAMYGVECPDSFYNCFDFAEIQTYPLIFLILGLFLGFLYGKIKNIKQRVGK